MAIPKAALHSITKHRLPNWRLLILYWSPLKYFSNCHGNWKGICFQCCYPWWSSTISLWKNSWCPIWNRTSWYFSIQGAYSKIGRDAIILRIIINEYFFLAFCLKLYSSSKSSWGKILRYYQHSSVPKILADESCKNFGVFLFHTMRQTHPQLTGTIREKKKLVNNLTKCYEKKLVKKS